ncbi:hypothetical protein H0E87_007364 [Populus deltoides]|uniref:Uncharacterized protein n=1 Tax=Populus deltoides TaxID=3696 RepID=A0A8T2ZAX4_POPDE|nr:hypothetical protein H0E87_007364 [Populus deltoides]
MTSDTPACFTDISPADVALQLHSDSTPARQQLQQQYDTSITQSETFQQETVCFTDISPADVALQLHGDSTPARQQLQQQSDTPITQPETFQQEIVHTSSPDITNSAAVQSLHDLSNSGSPTDPSIEPSSSLQHHSPKNDIQQVAAPTRQRLPTISALIFLSNHSLRT